MYGARGMGYALKSLKWQRAKRKAGGDPFRGEQLERVVDLERATARLGDDALSERVDRFRRAGQLGSPLEEFAIEMFATLREVGSRTLGQSATAGQIEAALLMARGAVAQLGPDSCPAV